MSIHPGAFMRMMALVETGPDRFTAPEAPESEGRMYGGQLLAQALAAAGRTVADDRQAHSLHAYFLAPGDVSTTVDLQVERVRDGRSFSSRCVSALQGGRELFRMVVSYHIEEPGEAFASHRMPDVPPPEQVALTYAAFSRSVGENQEPSARGASPTADASGSTGSSPVAGGVLPWEWDIESRPMDTRCINPADAPLGEPVGEDQRMWMRISEPLPESPGLHRAGLAYLSDSTLIDHVVLPHGRRWQEPGLTGASLDHAMWFHGPVRADEWLLFDQTVEATGSARGLAMGRIFDGDGILVATCAQEGLIRWT